MKLIFDIFGNDSPINKTLAKLKADMSKTTSQASAIAKKASADYNAQIKESIKLTNDQTSAIKKRNIEDGKRPAPIQNSFLTRGNLKGRLEGFVLARDQAEDPTKIAAYNRKIQETTAEIQRMSNVGKTGFDSMGNAIAKNTNVAGKLWSGLRKVAQILPGVGVAGLLAFAIEPIMNYIQGLDLFGRKATQAKLKQEALSEAFQGDTYTDTIKQVNELTINIELAKEGLYSKKTVVEQYNKSIGAVAGQVKNFDEVEKAMVKNADAYIKMTLYKAAANLQLEKAAKKAAEIQENSSKKAQEFANGFDQAIGSIAASGGGSQFSQTGFNNSTYEKSLKQDGEKRKAARQKQLDKEKSEFSNNAKELLELAGKAAKEMGGVLGLDVTNTSETNQYASALARQKDILDKITAARDESVSTSLTADQQEIAASKRKYDALRNDLIEYNTWATNYNKNHLFRKVGLVDVGQVDAIAGSARANIVNNQAIAKTKEFLRTQEQMYKDFEDAKAQVGKKATKEQYKVEFDTYQEFLQKQLIAAESLPESSDKEAFVKSLRNQINTEISEEKRKYTELLSQFQTYADTRRGIEEKYSKIAADFRKQDHEEQAKLAEEEGRKQLTALDTSNIEKWESYKNLFDNLEKLSKKETLIAIEELEKQLKAFEGSVDARKKAEKEIAQLKKSIETGDRNGLREAAEQLGRIAAQFNTINGNISSIAGVIVNAASSYIEILKGIDDYKNSKSNTEKITAGLGIAGAAINIASSVVGYFKGLKAAKEKAKADVADFYASAIKGELSYQALLRQRSLDDAKRGKTTYQGIVAQLDLLKKQSPQIQAAYDKIFSAIQGGGFVSGKDVKKGNLFRKSKTYDIMASLAGSDYARLEQLYTQGQLKDQVLKDFEALKALREELEKAGIDVQELQKQLNEMLTGTSVEGLSDALADLFANGKTAAQDFGDSFEEILRKAIVNGFKYKYIEKESQILFDQLAKAAEDGVISSNEADAFKKAGQEAGARLKEQFNLLTAGLGLDFGGTGSSGGNSLKGSIKRDMTEETGTILTGYVAGLRLTQLQTNNLITAQTGLIQQQLDVAMSSIRFMQAIEINTRRSADAAEGAMPYLQSIDNGIKNNVGLQLRAAGKFGY